MLRNAGHLPRSLARAARRRHARAFATAETDADTQTAEGYTQPLEGLTGGYMLHEALVANGVRTVFGYSGGAVLPVLDAFHGSQISFVNNRSEQCCGHAAQGYAKATGECGVILTTSGPGLTNIITPLQDAKGDSVPLVALSGQVPTGAVGTDAFQECLAVDLTTACTKWSYQIQSVEEVPAVIHEAFHVAMSGKRGPVHLDLPKDVMTTILQPGGEVLMNTNEHLFVPPPSPETIQDVADLIAKSSRPVIYAGQGTIDCSEELTEFVHKSGIPCTTTLHAMGCFDETHPLSLHMLGMHGAVYANYAIQNADLILAIGSRFDDRTTGNINSYAPEALKAEAQGKGGIVHFDIESSQFGRVIQPTIAVEGDCKDSLSMLTPLVETKSIDPWLKQIDLWKESNPFLYAAPEGGKLKTQMAIEAVYKATTKLQAEGHPAVKDEVFVATGVGNHQMMACQFYRWTQPRSIITSGSLGTMGFGLPSAIGAQVGKPDSTVILFDGDGSFNMTLNDLGTIMQYQLPVKICVMNDFCQTMVANWQKLFFEGRTVATDNINPDYVALGEAHNIESFRISSVDELDEGCERMMKCTGPVLVEFMVEPDICLPMVAPGKALDDMFKFGDVSLDSIKVDTTAGPPG